MSTSASPGTRIASEAPTFRTSRYRATRIAASSSTNAVSFSSACTTKRFPSSRCASTIQIVRPQQSIAETTPQLNPALLRLSAMTSQYFTAASYSTRRASQPLPYFPGRANAPDIRGSPDHQATVCAFRKFAPVHSTLQTAIKPMQTPASEPQAVCR